MKTSRGVILMPHALPRHGRLSVMVSARGEAVTSRRLRVSGRYAIAAPQGRCSMGGNARRDCMIRTALFIAAGLTLAAPVAWAQGAPPESEDNRYAFSRADNGYLRLDGRTGQVSICTRRPVGWACQAAPDERSALEAEIARLQGENVALKKELLAHNLALPGAVKPDQSAPRPEAPPRLQLPSDADLDKVMGFMEKVWRRLVDMVVTLQKDLFKS